MQLHTSDDPAQSCGIGLVGIKGIESGKLVGYLWSKYRIWVTAFVSPGEYEGIRVTPNVYTTLEEIDTFTEAMIDIAKRGTLPA